LSVNSKAGISSPAQSARLNKKLFKYSLKLVVTIATPVNRRTAFAALVVSQPAPLQPAPAANTDWTSSGGVSFRNCTTMFSVRKKLFHASPARLSSNASNLSDILAISSRRAN
jgi:hypothetical protein